MISLNSFSNSSPMDVSFFRKTGNVKLLKKVNIDLLSENLKIRIIDDYTIIEVEYKYKNLGAKDEIWYGFPVDFYSYEWVRPEPENMIDSSIRHKLLMYSKAYIDIPYFSLYDNDIIQNVTFWDTDSLYSIKENENFRNNNTVYRRWYVSKIIFQENETKTIKVEYKVKNNLRDDAFWMGYGFSDRKFTYHLTPSSNWGDGIVEDFSVSINCNYFNKYGINCEIEGLKFTTTDSLLFSFNQINYDLNNSDRINIKYDNSFIKNAGYIKKIRKIPVEISKIETSSNDSLSKYLYDNNPNTCWIGKKGDWIDIYFYNKIDFLFLNVLNGNYSSFENFNKYSKIKKYMLQRNGDEIITYIDSKYVKTHLPEFKNVSDTLKTGFSQQFLWWDCGTTTKNDISHFRIYIQDIYEGSETDSVAISEIYFL